MTTDEKLNRYLAELAKHQIMAMTPLELHHYERGRFYGATAGDTPIRWFQIGSGQTPRKHRHQFQHGFLKGFVA